MTTSIVKLPFVAGIDTAGDPASWDQTGKFRRLENVRVELGAGGALVPRETAQSSGLFSGLSAQSRISEVEGRTVGTSESEVMMAGDDGDPTQVGTFSSAALVGSRPIEQVPEFQVAQWGTAAGFIGTDYEEITVSHFVGATAYRLISQVTVEGVGHDAITIASGASPAASHSRFWVLLHPGNSGFSLYRMSGNDFVSQIYNHTTRAWSATTVIYAATWVPLDTQLAADGTAFCLGYDSGTGDTLLLRVNSAGAVLQTRTVATSPNNPLFGALAMVAPDGSGNPVCHAWTVAATGDGDTIRAYNVNPIPGTVSTVGTSAFSYSASAPTGISAGGEPSADLSYAIAVFRGSSTTLVGELLSATTSAGVTTITPHIACPIRPLGRLWVDVTRFAGVRVWGARGTQCGLWSVLPTVTAGQGNISPIGIHSSLRSGADPATAFFCPRSIQVSGAESAAMLPVDITSNTTSTCELVYAAVSDSMGRTVAAGGRTLMLSGSPRTWDGTRFAPAGLSPAPFATLTPVGSGGSLSAGVYIYALVWEWTDARGLRQQSAPTLYNVTCVANDSVTIVVSTFHAPLDERLWDPSQTLVLVVYRSTVGGTVCYRKPRLLTLPVLDYAAITGLAYPSFTDTYADASWSSNETLYGQGGDGELPNIQLEATTCAVGFGARFLGVLAAFPNQVWYSKEFRDGRGFEFNPALMFICPGNIVALATQDGNVYAFGANDIWVFAPSFADNTGLGASPVDPTPVGQGIGCAWPQSVVATPVGIFFWGARGCYLLQRGGGAPTYIGQGVEGISFTTVVGAAYNPRTGEVAFCTDVDSRLLVFNHYQGAWYMWEVSPADTNTPSFAGGVACVTDPFDQARVFAALTRGTQGVYWVNGENTTEDGRGGNLWPYVCTIELGTAAFGDVAANSRIRTLAVDCSGPAGATYTVEERDESGTLLGTQNFACDDGPVGIYQVVRQKTTGTRFTLISPQSGSTVRATRFLGAELEVARAGRNQARISLRKG